ncbi:MAG: MBL fold metallo-hydrolase [Nitrospinota bacterium]|nr:MBL fold metallo-hydrolase [Nitrospinota bacterium]
MNLAHTLSWNDFPEGFTPFFLDPTGANLEIKEISAGVYALLSSIPNVDNTGFIVGDKGVLVVDSHINISMAKQIQERIREVTDKPILYLINSNYHGDHTFGNCAFGTEVILIQHKITSQLIEFFEEEKDFLFPCVGNKPEIYDGITLRRPDMIFDDFLEINLGGITVELHYFGPANTPGDTITYVPSAKCAWTGNMTGGNLIITLESDASTYLESIRKFSNFLDVDLLIPAHNPMSDGNILDKYILYLTQLIYSVEKSKIDGKSLDETTKATPLDLNQPYSPPIDHSRIKFFEELHTFNVSRAYESISIS